MPLSRDFLGGCRPTPRVEWRGLPGTRLSSAGVCLSGRDGTGRDGTGRDGTGRDGKGREDSLEALECSGRNSAPVAVTGHLVLSENWRQDESEYMLRIRIVGSVSLSLSVILLHLLFTASLFQLSSFIISELSTPDKERQLSALISAVLFTQDLSAGPNSVSHLLPSSSCHRARWPLPSFRSSVSACMDH